MYKTIEECQKDVQRFSIDIDIQFQGVYSLIEIIKSIIDLVVSPIFYAFVALDVAQLLKFCSINKSILFVLNIIAISSMISKYVIGKEMDNQAYNDYAQAKIDMCRTCFQNYDGFEELADSERSKIFEEDICLPIGLIKQDKSDKN